MKDNETIAIGWITSGTIYNEFAMSVMDIIWNRKNVVTDYINCTGSYIGVNRQRLTKNFLEDTTADWLLMLDTDVIIRIKDFDTLVEAADAEKYPVLSGMYFFHFPDETPSFKVNAQTERGWLGSYPENSIVENLESVGEGYVLIHRSVFEKIKADNPDVWAPWFSDGLLANGIEVSEDNYFCEQCKKSGIPIALHTGATSRHIGKMAITQEHFLRQQKPAIDPKNVLRYL